MSLSYDTPNWANSISSMGPIYWGPLDVPIHEGASSRFVEWLTDVPGGNTNTWSYPLMVYEDDHNEGGLS